MNLSKGECYRREAIVYGKAYLGYWEKNEQIQTDWSPVHNRPRKRDICETPEKCTDYDGATIAPGVVGPPATPGDETAGDWGFAATEPGVPGPPGRLF